MANERTPACSPRPRVLVLTQYYRPEPNFITADVAEALAENMDVTVVTAHPNYPKGQFERGARWWTVQTTAENGVQVVRVPLIPDHSRSVFLRGISYLSFALVATVVAPVVGGRPDVVWVYNTPFTTALAAVWFRVVRRSRVVMTSADLWPESFVAAGVAPEGTAFRLSMLYRRIVNRIAHEIVCSTEGTRAKYLAEGIREDSLHYIPTWVDASPGEDIPVPGIVDGANAIVYAGNLGHAQALDTVVRAAARLVDLEPSIHIDFYGTGGAEKELKALARDVGAVNVRFHGRVPPSVALEASSAALGQIVTLKPSPLFEATIPSKLPFAMAAGSPILSGLQGEAGSIARASGGAIPFDPADPDSLVAAIRALAALSSEERAAMRASLRSTYAAQFAKDRLLNGYRSLFQRLARTSSEDSRVAS